MRSWLIGALCAGWIGAIGLGGYTVLAEKVTPGRAADAPAQWPEDSALARVPGRATIVQIDHPKCACTRASLEELNAILHELRTPTTTFILFVRPDGTEEGFEQTATWARAHELPGATVLRDDGGVEAARFGAWTSGQTLLYDADGKLLFAGGVTAFRGHLGDNLGRASVVGWVDAGTADAATAAVFGCELHDPTSANP
jgi:hypothetical protein